MPAPVPTVPAYSAPGSFTVDAPVDLDADVLAAAIARGAAQRQVGPTPFAVSVTRAHVTFAQGQMRVDLALAGAYVGEVRLEGVPYAEPADGLVQLREVRISFPGRSWGLGSFVKALRGPLERLTNRVLARAGRDGVAAARAELGSVLSGRGAPSGVQPNGRVTSLRIESADIVAGVLRLRVRCTGEVRFRVSGLPS